MVPGTQRQRVFQAHLNNTGLAHRHGGLALHEHDATDNLGCTRHHVHTRTRLEHTRLGSLATQIRKRHHKSHRLAKAARHAEHLTAIERGDGIAHQVERHTLTGQRPRRIAMHLNPTHATGRTRRQRDKLIPHRDGRIVQRSRHHGTGALDRKAAVDGQTRRGIGELSTGAAGIPASGNLLVKRSQQVIDPRAGLG